MKAIKWFLIVLVTLVLMLAVYIGVFLDPNAFKPQLSAKVEEATGRTLTIDGDIGWSLFPKVGLEIGGLTLGNLPGEPLPPLLSVEQAVVGVNLLPLLTREVEIEEVTLTGVDLNLVTLKDGRTSLDGLGGDSGQAAPASKPESDTKGQITPAGWKLGSLSLKQLNVSSDNRQAGVSRTLAVASLTLQEFEPGRAAPFEMVVKAVDPQMTLTTSASALLTVAKDFSRIQLDKWNQQIVLSGDQLPDGGKLEASIGFDANVNLVSQQFALTNLDLVQGEFRLLGAGSVNLISQRPELNLELSGNDLVLDPWMPESAKEGKGRGEGTSPSPQAGEPDLSILRQFDLHARMALDSIKAKQWLVSKPSLALSLVDGVFTLKQMKATAFEGTLVAKATLDSRLEPVAYDFDANLQGLSIQPLLEAAVDQTVLAGRGELTLKGKGASLAPDALMNNLVADGRLVLNDGALYGINIAQKIREVEAKISGESLEQATEVQKTDFSSFAAGFAIDKGVVTTPDLNLASPLLRVQGQGQANLVSQEMDYGMEVSIVGSLEGQGGQSLEKLKGLTIPLRIGGSFTDPSFHVDMDELLKNKVDQEGDKLKEKLEEKLKDKLFKGLGG
ncbi:AsmA family protein [Ferrimonas sediminicola]|uniref:AsmA family protein n=1 Tax=Ferrimonas sediminicola TaxID=2569538 RepID=A0A4U1BC29_9GAMM|nr:AsmA family protein [Ferrimonas sediminicola]TKB48395.1 AsmA family protein [Ferrimonas sediminicola]